MMRRRNTFGKVSDFIIGILVLAAVAGMLWSCGKAGPSEDAGKQPDTAGKNEERKADLLQLSAGALKAANIETAVAEEQESTAMIVATGTVEANQEKIQQATPLVSGRIERVHVALGDHVEQGDALAVIASSEIAEMHGNFHQAETRLRLAEQALDRVQRAENRAGVLQAKARLDEADANLRRARRLTELGAAAGKDLTSAEAAYASAKADYDYQNNISINREVQEARSQVETAQGDVFQLRNRLAALGAVVSQETTGNAPHDTSMVTLRSPIAGTITERLVNAGAGIDSGKPMFTIADTSTVWVIANVPAGQVSSLRTGSPAEIHAADLGEQAIAGHVAYINPILNEETRTGRVRIEIVNPRQRLKIGTFVDVRFKTSSTEPGAKTIRSLFVPDSAVQRVGDRAIVFLPSAGKPGEFTVRDVELGEPIGSLHQIRSGLQSGERVVTRGSFVLKTQLMKGELSGE